MVAIQNQSGLTDSYGTIWMNTGNWTGVNFAATTSYKELIGLSTNYVLASPSKDFSMTTNGRLAYTGLNTRNFSVTGYLYQSTLSGSANVIALFKNGVQVPGSESYMNGSHDSYIQCAPVSLSTNDYLSIFLQVRSGAGATTLTQIYLNAQSVI